MLRKNIVLIDFSFPKHCSPLCYDLSHCFSYQAVSEEYFHLPIIQNQDLSSGTITIYSSSWKCGAFSDNGLLNWYLLPP